MLTKNRALELCLEMAKVRETQAREALVLVSESLSGETKSTAGDKHETGRAMAHLEQEKCAKQLAEAEIQLRYIQSLNAVEKEIIGPGTLIQTDQAYFLVALGYGMVKMDGQNVFCISTAAPIYGQLQGKKAGDHVEFNGKKQQILKVS